MKTCKRLLDFIQIINAEGDVRACGWNRDNIIGNLHDDDIISILNSDKARDIRRQIAEGDYSNCPVDNCPYLSNENINEILVDYDESKEYYPETLLLAYEGNCNYSCTCCTSHQHMADTRSHDYTEMYDDLEAKLMTVLPYVKRIGANGRGELFASPRIMNILSQWKPIAPADQVSVEIETNGSLFNERNWDKVKNLGQYNLEVSITVMSFDETTYQYLSGTKLSIENIFNNLRFAKKLREQNVINYLELATVMQELNFREMPEFTRRCLEEFGADTVRIRPIMPGGILPDEIQWFMDIRNSKHPYYRLYTKIMKDPIFKDPRVLLWSNMLPSERGDYLKREDFERLDKANASLKKVLEIIKSVTCNEDFSDYINEYLNGRGLAICGGLGAIGRTLICAIESKVQIDYVFEKKATADFRGIPVMSVEEAGNYDGMVIIAPFGLYNEMKEELAQSGFRGEIIGIEDLLHEYENIYREKSFER